MFWLFVTPLEARQDVSNYIFVFAAAAISAAVLVLNVVLKSIKRNQTGTERQARKITNMTTIRHMEQIYGLSNSERDFLWSLCRGKRVPNLEFHLRFEQFSDDFFNQRYYEISTQAASDEKIQDQLSLLFSIRQKCDNVRKNQYNISSTTAIPEGSTLYYLSDTKEQYSITMISQNRDEIILTIPHDILNNQIRPKELSKISLMYQTKMNTAYLGYVRVIRYQNTTGDGEMVVTHCNNLMRYQRRQFKRVPMNNMCSFSAVKVTSGGPGKTADIIYTPLDRKYPGKLIELSAGGCSIETPMNIKQQQYIHLRLKIDAFEEDGVTGLIIATDPVKDNRAFILHIVFIKVSRRTRNKIFCKVYDYLG